MRFRHIVGVSLGAVLLIFAPAASGGEIEEANKSLTQRYAEELWNQGQASLIGDFVAVDIVVHGPGFPDMKGLKAFSDSYAVFRTTFPDFHVTLDELIAEGDTVALRWTESGTQKGEYAGIAPTEKHVTWTGMSVYRIANGKIAEMWVNQDDLGLLRQLGAIPK